MFVGQPVALVVAESEAAAADAAPEVNVTYTLLPAATDLESALAADAPLVWPEGATGDAEEAAAHGTDVSGEEGGRQRSNLAGPVSFRRGDPEAAFASAHAVVERSYRTAIVHQSYIEPHATVVDPNEPADGVTVWSCTQAQFAVRKEVADLLGMPESDVHVKPMPVGGGFGGKFMLYEPLVALAARAVGAPLRLVLTRQEEMLAAIPAPAAAMTVKLAADADGTLTAIAADYKFDGGCFPNTPHSAVALMTGSLYQCPNFDIHGAAVVTNKPSSGAYRAPGSPQLAYALESTLDELARELSIDPLELRLRSASRPGEPMANDQPWPNIGMREVLERAREHPIWRDREKARAAGRGVGVAIGGWMGGVEGATAACTLERDGTLHVHVGSVDLTGTTTGFAMIAADAFGIAPEQVRVISADSDAGYHAGASGGSKITYTVGPAVFAAAREAREQTLRIAATEFEADEADLEIVGGAVRVKGVPAPALPLAELAAKTMQFGGRYAPVKGNGRLAPSGRSPAFCAQLAEVEVDAETGAVEVHRLAVVQDVGKAINPLTAGGQLMGGAIQGLGWALYEAVEYDREGQLRTGSLMDYAVPNITQSAHDLEVVMVEVPSDHGPYGARGVGEPPVIATAGAVANAIRHAGCGRVTTLPMTPARVLDAIDAAAE
jgi:CO/xanthine dehydrogenase Mo-binding subunit